MSSAPSYRDRLLAIYTEHAPSKAHQVDVLLQKYQGREEALIAAAAQKYGVDEALGKPAPAVQAPPVSVAAPREEQTKQAGVAPTSQPPPPPPPPPTSGTAAGDGMSAYHERLQRIYEKYSRKRVPFVARDLAKYPGREEDVIRAAVKKYGPEPTSPLTDTGSLARATAGPASEGGSPPDTAKTRSTSMAHAEDYRARITELYQQYAPQRLPRVEHELVKYKGREEALLRAIEAKYVPASSRQPAPQHGEEAKRESTVVASRELSSAPYNPPASNISQGTPHHPGVSTTEHVTTDAQAYRARITELYQQYAPQRLPRVEHELIKYKGREEALVRAIEARYVRNASSAGGGDEGSKSSDTSDESSEEAGMPAADANTQPQTLPPPPPSPPPSALVDTSLIETKEEAHTSPPQEEPAASPALWQQQQQQQQWDRTSFTPMIPPASEASPAVVEPNADVIRDGDQVVERAPSPQIAPEPVSGPEPAPNVTDDVKPTLTFLPSKASDESPSSTPERRDNNDEASHVIPPERLFTISPTVPEEAPVADSEAVTSKEAEPQDHFGKVGTAPGLPAAEEVVNNGVAVADKENTGSSAVAKEDEDKQEQLVHGSSAAPSPAARLPPTPQISAHPAIVAAPEKTPSAESEGRLLGSKAAFSLPAFLVHDVFMSLGATKLTSGVDMVNQETCRALLCQAFGIDLAKEGAMSAETNVAIAKAIERYLLAEFVTENQFTAFLYAYGAARLWTEREAAYHVRRAETFLKKCQNALLDALTSEEHSALAGTAVASTPKKLLGAAAAASTELNPSVRRELRSGFWVHYCIFPCVLPSWKRCWAFASAASGGSAEGLSRLSICYKGSAKVDLAIPFDKVLASFLESMHADKNVSAGGVAPPTAYAKNGLVLRIADGPNPLEVRLCCEEMRYSQGILKAYQLWHAKLATDKGVGTEISHSVSRVTGGSGKRAQSAAYGTPSSTRRGRSGSTTMLSPHDMSVIARDPVLRELAWTRVWVSERGAKDSSGSVHLGVGVTPQPCAWAVYNGLLLHTRLKAAATGGSSPASSSSTVSWDIAAEAEDISAVDELPVAPPGRPRSYYPVVITSAGSAHCVFVWARTRLERTALLGQLKRLVLRRRLLRDLDGAQRGPAPLTDETPLSAERALSFSPSTLANGP